MKYASILLISLFLASCGGNDKNGAASGSADSTQNGSLSSENSSIPANPVEELKGILGTYVGNIPCQDCKTSKVALSLNGDQSVVFKQKKTSSIDGKESGVEEKGKWTANESFSEVSIALASGAVSRFRIVSTQALLPLDSDGKTMNCQEDCSLTKMPPRTENKTNSK